MSFCREVRRYLTSCMFTVSWSWGLLFTCWCVPETWASVVAEYTPVTSWLWHGDIHGDISEVIVMWTLPSLVISLSLSAYGFQYNGMTWHIMVMTWITVLCEFDDQKVFFSPNISVTFSISWYSKILKLKFIFRNSHEEDWRSLPSGWECNRASRL